MSAAIAAGGAFEEPTLSWLTAALTSSVGKKCVMGVTGLFLCFFLVVHLAGNLLLYVGAEQYNHYAHALHANPVVIRGAEFFLYLAFIVHIYLAITTHCENDAARGHGYAIKQTKRKDRTVNLFGWTPDTTMFVTGAIVLAFILIHVNDFSWNLFRPARELEPYDKAVHLLGNVTRGVVYLIGCLVLGVHVAHGFQSAFQSLGLNHPQFTCWIRKLSIVFAFVVTIGFGSFVVWGLGKGGHVESSDAETAPAAPEETPAHGHAHTHPEHDQK